MTWPSGFSRGEEEMRALLDLAPPGLAISKTNVDWSVRATGKERIGSNQWVTEQGI
jgi:hypothetical protein